MGAIRRLTCPALYSAFHAILLCAKIGTAKRRTIMGARAVRHAKARCNCLRSLAAAAMAGAAVIGIGGDAQARLVRIDADPPAVIDLPVFGATGPYLKISGTFEGELDPTVRHNAVIADIDL